MKQCKDIYQENANLGDWIDDQVEHDFSIVGYDGEFDYKQCSHCKGKEYPEEYC